MKRLIRTSDIPDSILRPQDWPMWSIVAYTGKRGDVRLGRTFVRADSEASAVAVGRTALRLIGVRGRYVVNATRYFPWLDLELSGYVAYVN